MHTNQPLINIEGLSHSFGAGATALHVLRAVNLQFYPGEITIIVGPSGSGKTTILTLAGALRSVQSGAVEVLGTELNGATDEQQWAVRRKIGFIFQHHNLLGALTACENVQLGLAHEIDTPKTESRERALTMLGRVGLADHAHKYPDQLSGGQRQRVAIARALVRNPQLVMADEPTAALDSHSGREVVALLQKLAREEGCAIMMVTHDNRILDIADRIVSLEDGHIEENHVALQRISDHLVQATQALSQYLELVQEGQLEAYASVCAQTQAKLNQDQRQTQQLAVRRVSEQVRAQTDRLVAAVEQVSQTEAAVRQFIDLIQPSGLIGGGSTSDRLYQSLSFLLLTAADAMASARTEELESLIEMTSDRGSLMETLRQRSQDDNQGLVFDLTIAYARAVYFLHALAKAWVLDHQPGA